MLDARYVVYKLKNLTDFQREVMGGVTEEVGLSSIDCVVVEKDWPIYQQVVELVLSQ